MNKCKKIILNRDICSIEFGKAKYSHSKSLGMTIRNEEVIVSYNSKNKIIDIELLSGDKPCQKDGIIIIPSA